jgi:hypothetical protein
MTASFETFLDVYGRPDVQTAADLESLGLAHSQSLQRLLAAGVAGIYGDGVLSLASHREAGVELGPWSAWLPAGARIFGCTGLGTLFVTAGTDVWLVDTQYGQVVASPYEIEEFVSQLALPEARELFQESLVRSWVTLNGPLAPTDVLAPTPALPLGGDWSLDRLAPARLGVHLSITGQLFGPGTDTPIEFR